MTFERKLSKIFKLNDETWMKHANPWSVWTRYSVLPVIVLAFRSRIWIGWWHLIPVTISILRMFTNPIFFSKPKSTKNWASKSVLGERVYLNRDKIQIPKIHQGPILIILNLISGIGFFLSIWAIINYSIWGAILGVSLTYLGKSCFLDRMVWLYEDMKKQDKTCQNWEY